MVFTYTVLILIAGFLDNGDSSSAEPCAAIPIVVRPNGHRTQSSVGRPAAIPIDIRPNGPRTRTDRNIGAGHGLRHVYAYGQDAARNG